MAKKKVVKSEDEWIRVENNHEPIITKEQFDIVQELLIRDTRVLPETNTIGLLGGVVYCADCGTVTSANETDCLQSESGTLFPFLCIVS